MTEERILRLTRSAYEQLTESVMHYAKTSPVYQIEKCLSARTKSKIFYANFEDLEESVNEVWEPRCRNDCKFWSEEDFKYKAIHTTCEQCIYRKRD